MTLTAQYAWGMRNGFAGHSARFLRLLILRFGEETITSATQLMARLWAAGIVQLFGICFVCSVVCDFELQLAFGWKQSNFFISGKSTLLAFPYFRADLPPCSFCDATWTCFQLKLAFGWKQWNFFNSGNSTLLAFPYFRADLPPCSFCDASWTQSFHRNLQLASKVSIVAVSIEAQVNLFIVLFGDVWAWRRKHQWPMANCTTSTFCDACKQYCFSGDSVRQLKAADGLVSIFCGLVGWSVTSPVRTIAVTVDCWEWIL